MFNSKRRNQLILVYSLIFSIFTGSFAFASEVYSGTGDQIVDVKSTKKTSIITFTHQGSSNFIVSAKDKNAENIDLLVNEIGSYSGTTLIYPNTKTLKYLEISADGSWTTEIKALKNARKWSKKAIEGNGDDVIQLTKLFPASTKLKFNFTGDSNFIVMTFDKNGKKLDLKANEIGNYSGTKFLGKSVKYLQILAHGGSWSISR